LEHPVCSIFIGHANKKNNWDEIARVFIQQRFSSQEFWANQKEEGQGQGMCEYRNRLWKVTAPSAGL
jgi:hypothetical protein